MFQLTPSATAVESIQYDNAFRMCFSDPDQGKASADYISENNLAKKIAVIYNSSDQNQEAEQGRHTDADAGQLQ